MNDLSNEVFRLEMLTNSSHLDDWADAAGFWIPLKARGVHDDLVANYRKLVMAPKFALQAWVLQELSTFALTEGRRTEDLRRKAMYVVDCTKDTVLYRATPRHLWFSARVSGILVTSSNLKVPSDYEPDLSMSF